MVSFLIFIFIYIQKYGPSPLPGIVRTDTVMPAVLLNQPALLFATAKYFLDSLMYIQYIIIKDEKYQFKKEIPSIPFTSYSYLFSFFTFLSTQIFSKFGLKILSKERV